MQEACPHSLVPVRGLPSRSEWLSLPRLRALIRVSECLRSPLCNKRRLTRQTRTRPRRVTDTHTLRSLSRPRSVFERGKRQVFRGPSPFSRSLHRIPHRTCQHRTCRSAAEVAGRERSTQAYGHCTPTAIARLRRPLFAACIRGACRHCRAGAAPRPTRCARAEGDCVRSQCSHRPAPVR